MSGIVNKVKEALHSGSSTHSGQPEGTHGHHSSRTANAADPRIDSDRDHRAAPATGAHDGSYTASDNYTYGSNNRGVDGPATRTDGPHSANIANQVDPRIDSDRDHSRNVGMNPSGTATTGTHTGTTGTSGLHSSTGTHTGTTGTSGLHSSTGTHTGTHAPGPAPNTAGPHKSDMMNKLNPTVDSDLDGSRNMGLNSNSSTTTGARTGTTGTTGLGSSTHGTHTGTTGTTGLGSSTHGTHTGTTGLHSSTGTNTTAGPHKSDMMNKLNPTVDSDLDGSRNMGLNSNSSTTTGTRTGTTGTTGLGSSTHGTHTGTTGTAGGKPAVGGFGTGSNTHSTTHGTTHGTTTGVTGTHAPGPAPNTAGPHKSDMMNKIDPRVDSDMDGSKTYGGDKTYTRS